MIKSLYQPFISLVSKIDPRRNSRKNIPFPNPSDSIQYPPLPQDTPRYPSAKQRGRQGATDPCLCVEFQGRMQESTAEGSDAPGEPGEDASGQQRRIRWVGDGRDTHPHHLSLRAVSPADGRCRRRTCSCGSIRRDPPPPLAHSDSRYRRTKRGRYLPVRYRRDRTCGGRGGDHRGCLRCQEGPRSCGRGRGRGLVQASPGRGSGSVSGRHSHLLDERPVGDTGPRHGRRLPSDTHDRTMTDDTHAPYQASIGWRGGSVLPIIVFGFSSRWIGSLVFLFLSMAFVEFGFEPGVSRCFVGKN